MFSLVSSPSVPDYTPLDRLNCLVSALPIVCSNYASKRGFVNGHSGCLVAAGTFRTLRPT